MRGSREAGVPSFSTTWLRPALVRVESETAKFEAEGFHPSNCNHGLPCRRLYSRKSVDVLRPPPAGALPRACVKFGGRDRRRIHIFLRDPDVLCLGWFSFLLFSASSAMRGSARMRSFAGCSPPRIASEPAGKFTVEMCDLLERKNAYSVCSHAFQELQNEIPGWPVVEHPTDCLPRR